MEESSRTVKYTWKLENFCFCDFYSNRPLNSPSFEVNVPVSSKWYLYMFPNGHGIDKYVGIYLKRCKKDMGPKEIRVRFKISLLDSDGNLCPETSYMEELFTKDCEWGHNKFIKRSDLNTGCPFLYQDTLTWICQIMIIDPNFSGEIQRQLSLQPGVMEENKGVYNAIKSIYEDKLYSDMILKSKSKTFPVHKCILRARLPGMFRKLKNNPNIVFSDDHLTEKILRYAYGGRLDIKCVNPFSINKSLAEYGLLHLKKDLIPQSDEYLAQTYFYVQKCSYSWKIFTSLLNEENEIVSSFISNGKRDTAFLVHLEKKETGEWKTHIKALKSSNDDIFVRCRISVRDPNTSVSVTYEHKYTSNHCWESPFTIRLENSSLTFRHLPNCLNCGDFFYLDFQFIYSGGKVQSSIQQVSTDHTSYRDCNINDFEKLLSDFEDLYYKQYEFDTTISVGNREFKVHKCILCARSPFFRAMFMHDMKEKENNRVPLKSDQLDDGLFADVVDKLLLFTYCGKFDARSPEFASHLLSAIDMYMIGENYEDM